MIDQKLYGGPKIFAVQYSHPVSPEHFPWPSKSKNSFVPEVSQFNSNKSKICAAFNFLVIFEIFVIFGLFNIYNIDNI